MLEMGMKFLSNDQNSAHYNTVIRNAEENITLVTPWFRPTEHLKDNLENSLRRDVIINLVTRPKSEGDEHEKNINYFQSIASQKGRLHKKSGGFLGIGGKTRSLERLNIKFIPKLHAKLILRDEDEAVISSSNFLRSSLTRNVEAGVYVSYDSKRDKEFFEDIKRFIHDISNGQRNRRSSKCKNCGKELSNPKYPFCYDCYQKIIDSKTCPKCGGEKNTGFLYCYNCSNNK